MRTAMATAISAALLCTSAISAETGHDASLTPTEELLTGMVTEEVEPGVYRVVNDGVRDLASKHNHRIVAGQDGGVWLLRRNRFFRLAGGAHRWASERPFLTDFEVAPDGTVWTATVETHSTIRSFDGEEWTTHWTVVGDEGPIEITPDGRVWAFRQDGDFGYLEADRWQTLGHLDGDSYGLLVASAEHIWAATIPDADTGDRRRSYRFVDGSWQRLHGTEGPQGTWQDAEDPIPSDAESTDLAAQDIGSDGTFWGVEAGRDFQGLVRFDDSGWSRWPLAGAPYEPQVPWGPFRVIPGAGVWFATFSCAGLGRFDGESWDRYLPHRCVWSVDVAADGTVWLLATGTGSDIPHVYVISRDPVEVAAE